jgi:hypothetical protein
MAKKVIPRDKSRVEHAAKQGAVKKPKAQATRRAPQQSGSRNRRRGGGKAATAQKGGIGGFFQRLLGRFRRQ